MRTQASENKKNQDILSDTINGTVNKNLSTIIKSVNSKKQKLTKSKKLDMVKVKNSAKANFSRMYFFTLKAKKTFVNLQKTFTKAPIL